MKGKVFLLALVVCLLAVGCGDGTGEPAMAVPTVGGITDEEVFDQFLEEALAAQLRRDPETVSSLGMAGGLGMGNDELTDVSDAYELETYALIRAQLERLHQFDRAALNPDRQLSYDLFEWSLQDYLDGQPYRFHAYPVNPTLGTHYSLVQFMTDKHRIQNEQDARDYVTRLEGFEPKFEQLIEWLALQEEAGIVPPRWMVERVLAQLDEFLAQAPEETALYTAFEAKVTALDGMDPSTRAELQGATLEAIKKHVMPAYEALRDRFVELEEVAREGDGLWEVPDGEAAYAELLRHYTTTDMTADEIHELGLREVARIQAEMKALLVELGIGGETMAERMAQLAERSGLVPRERLVAEYEALLAGAQVRAAELFDVMPRTEVVVAGIDEPDAPRGYYSWPAADGSRPGTFYANLASSESSRYLMPTLVYHEAIPGHHLQRAIQFELRDVPSFRQGLCPTAYCEGWALYAERLAWEAGWYEGDPYGNLGRLQGELLRAARLVADTGIHAKRWTREQAIEYMVETTGRPEEAMRVEVERYIVMPGQATAYMVGMLQILALRERVEAALADEFDIKNFHNVVLTNGGMPLSYLEQVVETEFEIGA